jgi:hypothetical protein
MEVRLPWIRLGPESNESVLIRDRKEDMDTHREGKIKEAEMGVMCL